MSGKDMYIRKQHITMWFILSCMYVAFCLVVVNRYPVHSDLLQSADRAINLFLGNGYRIDSHPHISHNRPFSVSNSPIHDILLYLHFKVFGYSLGSVRSFNYIVAFITATLLYLSALRYQLIQNSYIAGQLFIAILLSGSFMMSYMYSRYDTIGICVLSAAFYSGSISSNLIRNISLLLCGVLLALSGLQFAAYGVILASIIVVFTGWRHVKSLSVVALGAVIGYLMMIVIYYKLGVFSDYINDIIFHKQTTAMTSGRLNNILRAVFGNVENNVLISVSLLGVIFNRKNTNQNSYLVAAVVLGITIPVFLSLAGNYTRWYVWMAFMPMILLVYAFLDKWACHSRAIRMVTIVLTVYLAGMYSIQIFVKTAIEFEEKEYAGLDTFLNNNIKEDHIVLSDAYSYIGAKRYANKVWSYKIIDNLNENDKKTINIIVYSRGGGNDGNTLKEIIEKIGGEWVSMGEYKVGRGKLRKEFLPSPKEGYIYNIIVLQRLIAQNVIEYGL